MIANAAAQEDDSSLILDICSIIRKYVPFNLDILIRVSDESIHAIFEVPWESELCYIHSMVDGIESEIDSKYPDINILALPTTEMPDCDEAGICQLL